MEEFMLELLKLLFGQIGVLGTILIAMGAYLAWLLHNERLDHQQTRKQVLDAQERRLEMHTTNVRVLTEVRGLLEAILRKVNGAPSSVREKERV